MHIDEDFLKATRILIFVTFLSGSVWLSASVKGDCYLGAAACGVSKKEGHNV